MRRNRADDGAAKSRKVTTTKDAVPHQGHGTPNDPYSLSGSDDEHSVPSRETRLEKREREVQKEEDLDKRLAEAGVETTGMPLEEKEALANALLQSTETVKLDESARKMRFTQMDDHKRHHHAESTKTKASKRPSRHATKLHTESDSTQDSREGKQGEAGTSNLNDDSKIGPGTTASVEDIDKNQKAILDDEPNKEGKNSPDFEIVTDIPQKGQGRRTRNTSKEEPNIGRNRSRKLSSSTEKKEETPVEIESSGSETTDENMESHTSKKQVETRTAKNPRSLKRSLKAVKSEGQRKRQKSVNEEGSPEVCNADDSGSHGGPTEKKTENQSKKETNMRAIEVEMDIKVSLKVSQIDKPLLESSSTDEEPLLPVSAPEPKDKQMVQNQYSPLTEGRSFKSQGRALQVNGSQGHSQKGQGSQGHEEQGHPSHTTQPQLLEDRVYNVEGDSEPLSGLSPSPDLFESQPVTKADHNPEVAEEKTPDEPLPVGSNGPDIPADISPYDVYYESAKVRSNNTDSGNFKITVDGVTEEEDVEDKACPFSTGTPSPHHKPLINKNKLKRKLFDPEPHFTPDGISPTSQIKTIKGYLKRCQLWIRESQRSTVCKLEFENPVIPGRHHEKTLFAKIRGEPERDFFLDSFNDVEYGLPDIDDTPNATATTQRRNGAKRPRRCFGDADNSDDDEDFVALPKSKGVKKPRVAKTVGVGKAMPRRQAMRENAASSNTADYFQPFKTMRRHTTKKKNEEEVYGGETQRFEPIDIDESSNSSLPSAQPTAQSREAKAKLGRRNSTSSAVPTTTMVEDNESIPSSGKGSGRTTPSDTKFDQKSIGSTHSSPLPFKLTGENTLVYNDDDTDEEVEKILTKTSESKPKSTKKRKKTPLPENVAEPIDPTFDDYFADTDRRKASSVQKPEDDIVLFESPEEEEPRTKSPKIEGRRTLKYEVKRKQPGKGETSSVGAGAVTTKRAVRGYRKQSVSPGSEKGASRNNSDEETSPGSNQLKVEKLPEKSPGRSGKTTPPLRSRLKTRLETDQELNKAKSTRGQKTDNKFDEGERSDFKAGRGIGHIKQHAPTIIYPVRGTRAFLTGRPGLEPRPEPEPLKKEDERECPLCSKKFAQSLIEAHASNCQGASISDEEMQQQPETVIGPSQVVRRRPPIRQGGLAEHPQEPIEYIALGRNAVNTNRGRLGFNRGGHTAASPYKIPKKKMGLCPICNTAQPQSTLEAHVDACLAKMEAGEPQQEQQEPVRFTRHSGLAGPKRPQETASRPPQRVSPTGQVIALSDSDEDTNDGSASINRKTRQRQSYMEDFTKNTQGATNKPVPTIKSRKITLDPPHPASSSTQPGPSARSSSPQPEIYTASSSGSSVSGSEDSISDADDDVPLRTALRAPRGGGAGRGGVAGRAPTTPRDTSTANEAPGSPVRTFQPISAIQSDSHIDFRNQFRQARGATAAGGTKRKRSTGGKGRKKKRRKRSSTGRGRGRGRGAKTPQVKQIKEEW